MAHALQYTFVRTWGSFESLASKIRSAKTIGFDLETTDFDPIKGRIRVMSFNLDDHVYVVDVFETGGVPDSIRKALHNPDADYNRPLIIGHNLQFDQKWLLYHHDIILYPLFDTMRASRILYNGLSEYNYDGAYKLIPCCERELDMRKRDFVTQMGGSNWGTDVLTQEQLDYAAEDVTFLPKLYPTLRQKLHKKGLLRTAKLEMEAVLPEAEIMIRGLPLSSNLWVDLYDSNFRTARERQVQLLQTLPHPTGQKSLFEDEGEFFNLNSADQLKASLRRMGIHLESTSKNDLAMIAGEYPIVQEIREYKKYRTRCTLFSDKFLSYLHPVTGRIHASYFPFTGAGRYACSKPNIQQIPSSSDFRSCFRAPDGRVIIACDYSQIEMRLMAELSRDPVLINVYNKGLDIHTYTAAIMCGRTYEEMDRLVKAEDPWAVQQRKYAKPVNFGLIYGMRPKKLVVYATSNYGVPMTLNQAEGFYGSFFRSYRGVEKWHKRVERQDIENGYTRTIGGRLRYLGPSDYNAYFNTPCQGSGADGLKRALWNVYHRLRQFGDEVFMCHMVHDEILVEAPDDPTLIAQVKHEVQEGMEEAMEGILTTVPCIAEPKHGVSWAEAH